MFQSQILRDDWRGFQMGWKTSQVGSDADRVTGEYSLLIMGLWSEFHLPASILHFNQRHLGLVMTTALTHTQMHRNTGSLCEARLCFPPLLHQLLPNWCTNLGARVQNPPAQPWALLLVSAQRLAYTQTPGIFCQDSLELCQKPGVCYCT